MIEGIRILKLLSESQIDFVVIGGVAAIMHGSVYVTRDVDVCMRFDEPNLKKLSNALGPFHPKHRITPQRLPFTIDDRNWQGLKNLYLATDIGILDCLSDVLGVGGYEEALKASELVRGEFGEFKTLTLDALIRAKEAAGREKDLLVLRELRIIKTKRENQNPEG
jgi:hypothetical protein